MNELDTLNLLVQTINKFFKTKYQIHHAVVQVSIPGPYLIRLDREAWQALNLGPVMMEMNEELRIIGFGKIEFGHSGCYIATRQNTEADRYTFDCPCNSVYWEEVGLSVDRCPECGHLTIGKKHS